MKKRRTPNDHSFQHLYFYLHLLLSSHCVQGIGKCSVCLDPTQEPFLLIRTEQGVYLINVETPEKTAQLYEKLCSLLKSNV